jgi:predicted alpha/beta-hydrolase family hydrolase
LGTTSLVYGADGQAPAALILAHGAGAGQQSPFITAFASAVSRLGLDVVTFNFPFVEQRRKIPDRPSVLEACYVGVIEWAIGQVESARRALFVGGKSMGGRIATQVAAAHPELPIGGIVLLGYPLHPPGRPAQRRDAHLPAVRRPMLFVQGARDAFGSPEELEPILPHLAAGTTLHVVPSADHSLAVPRSGASAQAAVYDDVQRVIVAWVRHAAQASPETH